MSYLWFNRELAEMTRGGVRYAIHNDHLGRPEMATSVGKAIVWKSNNGTFGGQSVVTNTIGGLNVGFSGQYFDAESGLWYNVSRYYDPHIGRYYQVDPIGLGSETNPYTYVGGNPVMWMDPLGLDVLMCSQPAQIPGMGWVDHQWLKTDTVEAGMGGTRGNVPGNQSGDMPGDPVQVTNHAGRSNEPGASCKKVDNVDEARVNAQLQIGRPLGRWGPTNQCQSFVARTLWNASTVDGQAEQNQRLLNSMVRGLR